MRERRLGQDVVGDALRELRERVRGARRHDEHVGALEVRIEILVAGRRASAANVFAVTNFSAPGVTSGTTSCPARTSNLVSSHAL